MVTRRDFMKAAALAGGGTLLNTQHLWGNAPTTPYFALHDFIAARPNAVFILRTTVDTKTNTAALKSAGAQLAASVLTARTDAAGALPVTTNVVLKPNMTWWSWDKAPIEQTMGIQTDANFVEGIIESLAALGIAKSSIYIREANHFNAQASSAWYNTMAQRAGVNLKEFAPIDQLTAADVQWTDVPNGVFFSRIPYLWPINSPGSCLLNIAKFKSHSMGMTLCSKNIQGTNARPYVQHCSNWGVDIAGVNAAHVVSGAFAAIQSNCNKRIAAKIPRWDLPGDGSGGIWMETHSARCLDNNSALKPLLNIVEGVYGREGPFVSGPADNGGYGRDILTNIVIFGVNALHVDIVGTYLAGHEPGNFGLFHAARERGLAKYLNPREVPLFEWKLDGSATPATLDSFTRTPIRTIYLRKAGEEEYHMVNEAFDYTNYNAVEQEKPAAPDMFSISQNFPNPFNPSTSIRFYIPKAGPVRLEIYDMMGRTVDVLVNGPCAAGDHLAVWNSSRCASGTYFYRMQYAGFSKTKSMVLVK